VSYRVMLEFIVVVAGGVVAYVLLSYFILSQRFPGEDPRLASARFTLGQQLIPFIVSIVVSIAFFFIAKSLGFVAVLKSIGYALVILSYVVNSRLDKRYGRLGANEEPARIGKVQVTSLLLGFLITVIVFTFISGFFHLPSIYPAMAVLMFLAVFIASIVWVRRSRATGKLQ
jgi:hypothetical protein